MVKCISKYLQWDEEGLKQLSSCGISQLKGKQEAMLAFLSGKDTFLLLPTRYGKSLKFRFVPLLFNRMLDEGISQYI